MRCKIYIIVCGVYECTYDSFSRVELYGYSGVITSGTDQNCLWEFHGGSLYTEPT